MTYFAEGERAGDFIAKSTKGEITLGGVNKDVVLYFYPKDMTPGCTTQAQDFSEKYDDFKKLDVEIIGVSRDSLELHKKFIEKHSIPYPLISDEDGALCSAYGVWQEKKMYGKTYMGIVRSTYLIAKDGVVKKLWKKVSPKGHADEVLKFCKNLT